MAEISTKIKRHYHLVGIGGIGMAGLASLLLAKGHQVSGSDIKSSALLDNLRTQGAQITIGHHASNVQHPDFVVYSSAISADNPEISAAVGKKVPVVRRAQLLSEIINETVSVTVCGAHGKTTTSSMIGHLLIKAGLDPTIVVGGIVNRGNYNASLGSGQYSVAELDESDGSFLYFAPHCSVITNIDYEHVDYYQNWENILDAYGRFIEKTREQGLIIGCGEDDRIRGLLEKNRHRSILYGFSDRCDLWAENVRLFPGGSTFECRRKTSGLGTIKLRVPGGHNVLNALACVAVGLHLNIPFEIIGESLGEFNGVQRRFQLKFKNEQIGLYDDYGHHPTEIRATLEAARTLAPKRIVVAFQPHRYSRTKYLMDEFVEALALADYVIITDIYAASEKPIEGVSAQKLCQGLKSKKPDGVIYLPKENIVSHLLDNVRVGDVILTLGAGDITRLSDDLAAALKGKFGVIEEGISKL